MESGGASVNPSAHALACYACTSINHVAPEHVSFRCYVCNNVNLSQSPVLSAPAVLSVQPSPQHLSTPSYSPYSPLSESSPMHPSSKQAPAPLPPRDTSPPKQQSQAPTSFSTAPVPSSTFRPITTSTQPSLSIPMPAWTPDGSVNCCYNCAELFGTFRRRHHCRGCGKIYCSKCTSSKLELPKHWGYNGPQRVCDKCFRLGPGRSNISVMPASTGGGSGSFAEISGGETPTSDVDNDDLEVLMGGMSFDNSIGFNIGQELLDTVAPEALEPVHYLLFYSHLEEAAVSDFLQKIFSISWEPFEEIKSDEEIRLVTLKSGRDERVQCTIIPSVWMEGSRSFITHQRDVHLTESSEEGEALTAEELSRRIQKYLESGKISADNQSPAVPKDGGGPISSGKEDDYLNDVVVRPPRTDDDIMVDLVSHVCREGEQRPSVIMAFHQFNSPPVENGPMYRSLLMAQKLTFLIKGLKDILVILPNAYTTMVPPPTSVSQEEVDHLSYLQKKKREHRIAAFYWTHWKKSLELQMRQVAKMGLESLEELANIHFHPVDLRTECYCDLDGRRMLKIPSEAHPYVTDAWLEHLLQKLVDVSPSSSSCIVASFSPYTVPESKTLYRRVVSSQKQLYSAQENAEVENGVASYTSGMGEKERAIHVSLRNRSKWYKERFGVLPSDMPNVTRQFLQNHRVLQSQMERFKQMGVPPTDEESLFTKEELQDLVFVFVPGLYSGFFPGGEDAPDQFKDWLSRIRNCYGIDTRYLNELAVDSSCSHNARIIFDYVKKVHEENGKQIVLLGYSKGSADVSTAIMLYGQELKPILRCWISMMGCFGGSAFASAMAGSEDSYRTGLLAKVVKKCKCKIDALQDITLPRRDALLREYPYPVGLIPCLSLIASIRDCSYDDLYPLYKFIHLTHKEESDGLVTLPDQTIPGSAVVYIRGMDHTGAGETNVAFKDMTPFMAALFATVLHSRPETPDRHANILVKPVELIVTEKPLSPNIWRKIAYGDAPPESCSDDPASTIASSSPSSCPSSSSSSSSSSADASAYTLAQSDARGASSSGGDAPAMPKWQHEELCPGAKIYLSTIFDQKFEFFTSCARLSQSSLDSSQVDRGQTGQVWRAEWHESTHFTTWVNTKLEKDQLAFTLFSQHNLRKDVPLDTRDLRLNECFIAEGNDCRRAVMFGSNMCLLVDICVLPVGAKPQTNSVFAAKDVKHYRSYRITHGGYGPEGNVKTAGFLAGAAVASTILFPPALIGVAAAGGYSYLVGKKSNQKQSITHMYE